MAGVNDTVIRLVADLELAGADAVADQIKRLAKQANIQFDEKDFVKKWDRTQKKVQSSFTSTIGDALKAGLSSKNLRGLTDTWAKLSKQIQKAQVEGADEAAKIHLRELEKRFKLEQAHVQKIAQRRLAALKEAQRWQGKNQAQLAEDFAKSIQGAFSQLKGGDFSGFIKGAGAGVTGLGGAALKAGKGEGTGAKALAGIGKFLSRVGPAIMAMGALVGAIGALVAVIIQADAKATELNRTLLESGVAGADLVNIYDDVNKKVNAVQKTFTTGQGAFAFNRIWGTTAKDHLQILGAYANAGTTLKEMQAGASGASQEMKKLKDHTQAALAYSKLLGVSAQEMAGNMASWMEDLGENINGVQQGLSAVTMAARDSGFGVKRFFSMVLQATSGMSMYNVRLEEAGGLLIRLGKILGAKVGGDFLQQLTKGFSGEGMQQRYKRVMTTKGMKGIYARSAEATGEDFLRKLRGSGSTDLADLLGVTEDTTGAGLAKSLGGKTAEQREALLAKARLTGKDDLVRTLTNLMDVSEGAQGGRGSQAKRLGSLDMGGKLAAMMTNAQSIIGTQLHKMNATQIMAFENITGVSGEQREQLARVSEAMSGNWKELQKLRASGIKFTPEQQAAQAKAFGGAIDDQGRIVAASFNEATNDVEFGKNSMKNLGDYLQSQGDTFRKVAEEGVPEDIRLATEIARNTTEMSKILEQGVEYWLIRINEAVQYIRSFFGGLSEGEKINKAKAVGQITENINKLRRDERSVSKDIADQRAIAASTKGEDRRRALDNIASLEKRIHTIQKEKAKQDALLKRVHADEDSNYFADKTGSEFVSGNQALVTPNDLEEAMLRSGAITPEAAKRVRMKARQKALSAQGVSSVAEYSEREMANAPLRGGMVGANMAFLHKTKEFEKTIQEAEKKALEEYQREDRKDAEKLHGKGGKAPKAIGEEVGAALDKTLSMGMAFRMQGALSSAGVDLGPGDALRLASEYRKTGKMPQGILEHLNKRTSGGKTVGELIQSTGVPLFEGLSPEGQTTKQRVKREAEATTAAARAGGKVGAGGDVYVTYHEYQSPHGWSQNQSKLKRVLSGRVG